MKTTFKYITFIEMAPKPKTRVFSCNNIHSMLEVGQVKWFAPWRQYCFFPTKDTTFNTDCLKDIAEFISGLTG